MIRKKAWLTGAALTGTVVFTAFGGTAFAADVAEPPGCVPAVSAVNGKIQGSGGYAESDDADGDFAYEAIGSLSLPLGCLFGFQADVGVGEKVDNTYWGGIAHLFIRDPESYLFGVTGGVVDSESATLYPIGPEAELYLGNFSLEAWGGYLHIDGDDVTKDSGFVIADAAFYLTDDFRVSIGGKVVDTYEAVRAGLEFQFSDTPMSFYAKAEYGEDDFLSIMGGLKFYFGGETKSLIRRHREDDPDPKLLDATAPGIGEDDDDDNDNAPYGDGDDGQPGPGPS